MKKIARVTPATDEPRPEYRFDYSQSRRNRFAPKAGETRVAVVLEPDVARVFGSARRVNQTLRSAIRRSSKSAGQAARQRSAKI